MTESNIEIAAGAIRLAGTFCSPDTLGPHPVVLMIHGSGPLDLDENIPGQRLEVFKAIAHRLADEGVASVRYDKRGCGKSTGDYYRAGHYDLVNDAAHGVDWILKEYPGAEVYLLGHSEGCLIAPQVALKRPAVSGLILLCPFVEGIESVLLRQAIQIEHEFGKMTGMGGFLNRAAGRVIGSPTAIQRKLIAKVRSTQADSFRFGLQKFPAKWMRELFEVDPEKVFQQSTVPMLLVGGAKDVQCRPEDVGRIAAIVRGEVESHVLENLTHVLRCDQEPASLLGSGQLLKNPIDQQVLDLVSAWIRRQAFTL